MGSQSRNAVLVFVALSAAAMAGSAYAQAGPTFEVSPAIAGGRAGGSRAPQKIAPRMALVGDIIALAYDLPLDRVERRPQWMYDDRYNVAVSTAAPSSLPEQKLLLQKLLAERFGLVVHRISYPSPVYFLVPGPKVNLTAAEEADAVETPVCIGTAGYPSRLCSGGPASMGDLAAWLYPQMGLPVLDTTGITGLFDIEMPLPPRGGAEQIIRAVRNALGLNLELHQGTAESLIIDRVVPY